MLFVEARDGVSGRKGTEVLGYLEQVGRVRLENLEEF